MGGEYWWVAPLAGTVAAVFGWIIARQISKSNEYRKEARGLIDGINTLVEEIQTHCHQYYCKPGNDAAAIAIAHEIRSKLKHVGQRVGQLDRKMPGSGKGTASIAFRKAVSSKLDDQSRPSLEINDPIFDEITQAAEALQSIIESEFELKFGKP